MEFRAFPKIPRLFKDIVVTEKIDGTNAVITIGENGEFKVGSRNRWISPEADNFGFARWAHEHKEELLQLGPGSHFGEWWGHGIQRGYGLKERRFSLFNVERWGGVELPPCVGVVPFIGKTDNFAIAVEMGSAALLEGSLASPGFTRPEGIVMYHTASNQLYKYTFEGDTHKDLK